MKTPFYKKKVYFLAMVSAVVIALIYIFCYTGPAGYDDLHYARLAHNLLKGAIDYGDHYSYRLVTLVTTAFSFWVFGVSEVSMLLPIFIATLLICTLIIKCLVNLPSSAILLAIALFLLSSPVVYYSTKLMPDMMVALSIVAMVYVTYRYYFSDGRKHAVKYGLVLALLFMFGFLSKATIILYLPVLGWLFFMDLLYRKTMMFWWTALGGMLVLMGMYLGITQILTGQAFARFAAISANPYTSFCSYELQSMTVLLKRVSYEFLFMTIKDGTFWGYVICIPFLLTRSRENLVLDSKESYFSWVAIILFLSSNFMSTSLTSYAPLCLDSRHYLALNALGPIAAVVVLPRVLEKAKMLRCVAALMTACGLVCWIHNDASWWQLYLPSSLLFVAHSYPLIPSKSMFYILGLAVLMIYPIDHFYKIKDYNYQEQARVAQKHVMVLDSATIATNEVQKQFLELHSGFELPDDLEVLSYEEAENQQLDYFLYGYHSGYKAGLNPDDLPFYVQNQVYWDSILLDDQRSNMRLVRLKVPLSIDTLLSFTTSFDHRAEGGPWNNSEANLTSESYVSPPYSQKLLKYSAGLALPLDSVRANRSTVYLDCRFSLFTNKETDAALVIAISDTSTENIYWKSLAVQPKLRVYNQWNTFDLSHQLGDLDRFTEGCELSIYLWNPKEETNIFIDDLSVAFTH